MSDREEWGPWIDHDGRGCPVSRGVFCRTFHADGSVDESESSGDLWSGWSWMVCKIGGTPGFAILRYQVRRPRALQQLREMIETLPAPSPKEDAYV